MEHFKIVTASSASNLETNLNLAFKNGYRLHSYRMVTDPATEDFFYSAVLELKGE